MAVRQPLVDNGPPEPPVLTHLLAGDLSLWNQLIQGGLGDLQIDRQLFDSEHVVLIFTHHGSRVGVVDNTRF